MTDYRITPQYLQRIIEALDSGGDPSSLWEYDDKIGGLLITEHYGASDADLSTERFTYLATYAAESLIKNAGYIGLLGDLEDELLLRLGESYRRLGNDAHAELLEESLKTLPNYPPIPTKEHREATLDSWEYGEKCDPTEPVFDRFTSIDDTAQDRLRYAVANAITS